MELNKRVSKYLNAKKQTLKDVSNSTIFPVKLVPPARFLDNDRTIRPPPRPVGNISIPVPATAGTGLGTSDQHMDGDCCCVCVTKVTYSATTGPVTPILLPQINAKYKSTTKLLKRINRHLNIIVMTVKKTCKHPVHFHDPNK